MASNKELRPEDLKQMAITRLEDATILYNNGRYECSVYICGYAIELALKYAICKTLNWDQFPCNRKEFEKLSSFKTHDLETLLLLAGIVKKVKPDLLYEWSIVAKWNPENRYSNTLTTAEETSNMLESSAKIIGEIWKI